MALHAVGHSDCALLPWPGSRPEGGPPEQVLNCPLRSDTSGHGPLLCQDALGRRVVGCGVTGPGSDLSEVSVWGCEPAALDFSDAPRCPPGPVAWLLT